MLDVASASAAVTPSEATARMPDGTLLRTLHWPADDDPWARALIVHGLGEHAGRYDSVARPMAAAGIDVHAYDHRGFGGSAGQRAYVERWDQLHDDLEQRLEDLRALHPELPLVLYGHSLGGLVATGYALSATPRPLPDLLVLSSPALDADVPGWKRSMASRIGRVLPHMRISNGALRDGLSHDPAIREAYAADPLCQFSSTTRFASEGFAEQDRLRTVIAALGAMPVPTYVFHGSEDPVVPVGASAVLEGKGNVTRVVHEGLRHECHHEPEHAAVVGAVIDWIRAEVPLPAEAGVAAGPGELAG